MQIQASDTLFSKNKAQTHFSVYILSTCVYRCLHWCTFVYTCLILSTCVYFGLLFVYLCLHGLCVSTCCLLFVYRCLLVSTLVYCLFYFCLLSVYLGLLFWGRKVLQKIKQQQQQCRGRARRSAHRTFVAMCGQRSFVRTLPEG